MVAGKNTTNIRCEPCREVVSVCERYKERSTGDKRYKKALVDQQLNCSKPLRRLVDLFFASASYDCHEFVFLA